MPIPDFVQASTSAKALFAAHPIVSSVALSLVPSLIRRLRTKVKSCLRSLGDLVDAYYNFKIRCADSKRRYEQAVRGGDHKYHSNQSTAL